MRGYRLVLVSLLITVVLWTAPGWAQQPRPGGTLRVALTGDLTFFNANQGPAPGYITYWVWNNIFNSLLSLTPPPELKVSRTGAPGECWTRARRMCSTSWKA
jgi:hypothetical protein